MGAGRAFQSTTIICRNNRDTRSTYSSVVCNGMSRGISFSPRPAQSTVVPSHWHIEGQSESMRHSPDSFMRNSSHEPVQWARRSLGLGLDCLPVRGRGCAPKLRHILRRRHLLLLHLFLSCLALPRLLLLLLLLLLLGGVLTFEFLLAQRFNAPAMHPLR